MTSDTILDGKKLLLVDDEPDVLDTLADLLAQCRIQTATSFSEAETLLENEDFDLAVLDIMGVSGYELLKIATRRKIPTVMLTAHAIGPEHVVKSHDEGAASYLPKEEMINKAWPLSGEKSRQDWLLKMVLRAARRLLKGGQP